MAEDAFDRTRTRRRRTHHKKKRTNRKLEKALYDLRWMIGGLALGLPLLGIMIYIAS